MIEKLKERLLEHGKELDESEDEDEDEDEDD